MGPFGGNSDMATPASADQLAYVAQLAEERGYEVQRAAKTLFFAREEGSELTMHEASELTDWLLAQPIPTPTIPATPEGE